MMNRGGRRPGSFDRIANRRASERRNFNRTKTLEKPEAGKPAGKKSRAGLAAFLILLIVGAIAFAVFYVTYMFNESEIPEQTQEETQDLGRDISAAGFDFITDKENRKILHLKPAFVINLSGLGGRRLMRTIIWLEVDNIDVAEEFNNDHAKFRRVTDDLVRTMKSWTYSDLAMGSGMTRLKNQLRDHINRHIKSGRVTKVFFKDVRFHNLLPRAVPPVQEQEDQQ